MRHLDPHSRHTIASQTVRQTKDGEYPSFASQKDPFGKYFAQKILAGREFGRCTSLQACLASRAELKTVRSRKPRPPSDLELHKIDHLTQLIFLSTSP